MASAKLNSKRRASDTDEDAAVQSQSEDEFGDGLLDGVLDSDSEEAGAESEEDIDDEEDDFPEDGSESSFTGAEDDIESDDIPPEDEKADRTNAYGAGAGAEAEELDVGPRYRIEKDATGGIRYVYDEIDPVYDSDDTDAQEPDNRIGNIPLSFYDTYPHIGYDINGKRIMRPATGEALDALLDSIEIPKGWTGLTNPATGKPLKLSQDELELLRKVSMNEMPEDGVDPYPDTVEWFTSFEEAMPLSAAPEPKRRFLPSKWEHKRIMKLVKAIREGRILPYKSPEEREREEAEREDEAQHFDLWAEETPRLPNSMHFPAPKPPPPGFDLSYRPPPEYLPTSAERRAWEETDPEDRDKSYLPQQFDSLRRTPAYDNLVYETFQRSLDLYLAPRVRKNRLNIDPNSLLPKLPRPEELRPFPTVASIEFSGHTGRVRSISVDPSGKFLCSGGDDGFVKIWNVQDGKPLWQVKLSSDEPVDVVRWRPSQDTFIIAATVAEDIFFIVPLMGAEQLKPELEQASRDVLDAGFGYATAGGKQPTKANGMRKDPPAKWARPGSRLEESGVLLKTTLRSPIKALNFHRRADYFCTVSPSGQKSAVAIHTLSKHLSQLPFKKPGLAQTAAFHPSRALFYVATQRSVHCYDLQRSELIKTIKPGCRWISSFDVHPGGENLIVGSYDRRLLWHDLELSNRPFKTLRFHDQAIRAVKFHGGHPLFADCSDDGTIQIFHSKVVNDLMAEPTIVPVKVLRGHKVVDRIGVTDIAWHPHKPWVISCGADSKIRLWS